MRDSSSSGDSSEEELLLIWTNDAEEDWVHTHYCELEDEQIIWNAGKSRYFIESLKPQQRSSALFTYWGSYKVIDVDDLEDEKDVIYIPLHPLAKDFAERAYYHVSMPSFFTVSG